MIVIYMGTHTTDPAREVMDSIRRLVRLLRVFDSEAQKTAGLSAAQVFVLRQLRNGDEASINELARRTCTDQSSVSVVVAKLVARGLIVRKRSPRDRRSALVSITPSGTSLLGRAAGGARAADRGAGTHAPRIARAIGRAFVRTHPQNRHSPA